MLFLFPVVSVLLTGITRWCISLDECQNVYFLSMLVNDAVICM